MDQKQKFEKITRTIIIESDFYFFLILMTKQEFMQEAVQLSLENMRAGKGGPFGIVSR